MAEQWFAVRRDLSPRRQAVLTVGAFLLPLLAWCVISYVPFIWHPLITVTDPGGSSFLAKDMMIDRGLFVEENVKIIAEGKSPAEGYRSNPVFLPPPHAVGRALYTAFLTPPVRKGEPWLHESLWHSLTIIMWGFGAAALIGVPVGIMCGTFSFFSKLVEPFVDFIRYMPAPAFGALMVAVCGINDGPKIAIVFIGTFFQLVLVVANTTRQTDRALLEAAQTLGAKGRQLVTHVVLPGILPNLYNDMRILLGWAWTYLIVAELIGITSGISFFISLQGRYRHYDNVFAGIILIGIIGLITDQILAILGRLLFPWQGKPPGAIGKVILTCVGMFRRKKAAT
jgi:NitT/TauT family transport system permease protein